MNIKRLITDYLWFYTVIRHRSRMGILKGPAYSKYLNKCKDSYLKSNHHVQELPENIMSAIKNFHSNGVGSFITDKSNELASSIYEKIKYKEKNEKIWSDSDSGRFVGGDIYQSFPEIESLFKEVLGPYLEGIYQSYFQIYYGLIYKSLRKKSSPTGSEIWHGDGGPGVCINLMVALSDVNSKNGAMEILPWPYTVNIFKNEKKYIENIRKKDVNNKFDQKDQERTLRAKFFESQIIKNYSDKIIQPQGKSGTIISMMNNAIHKGGFPNENKSRYVCIFHIYPSKRKTPYENYKKIGILKKGPYPNINEL